MTVATYRVSDGKIIGRASVFRVDQVGYDQSSQGVVELPTEQVAATHYRNGTFLVLPETAEEKLVKIRNQRNLLLAASDWTQLGDIPDVTGLAKSAWAAYRQALRDFPDTCDPFNPVWPTPPA